MDVALAFQILQLVGTEAPQFLAVYDRIKGSMSTSDADALAKMLADADAAADAQHTEAQGL